MNITTTSRHYELTPALKDYAETKVQNLTTFFPNIQSAHIIFTLEKYRHCVEVTLHVNGKDLVGHEESEDMYVSVDRVVERLERQILKYKGKMFGKKKSPKLSGMAVDSGPESDEESEEGNSEGDGELEIIPADPVEFPRLSLAEAIARLNKNGDRFSIFSNEVTNRLNVLYKRQDGSIGLIEA